VGVRVGQYDDENLSGLEFFSLAPLEAKERHRLDRREIRSNVDAKLQLEKSHGLGAKGNSRVPSLCGCGSTMMSVKCSRARAE
jgi:hypothetical protein